jgi:hypothetical protein
MKLSFALDSQHHSLDHQPAWIRAYLGFLHVAHIAEVGSLTYLHVKDNIDPKIARCLVSLMNAEAQRARLRAVEHLPFHIRAVRSMPSLN